MLQHILLQWVPPDQVVNQIVHILLTPQLRRIHSNASARAEKMAGAEASPKGVHLHLLPPTDPQIRPVAGVNWDYAEGIL